MTRAAPPVVGVVPSGNCPCTQGPSPALRRPGHGGAGTQVGKARRSGVPGEKRRPGENAGLGGPVYNQGVKNVDISRDEVRRIARLARLTLDEDETARLARELGDILGYVSRLAELDLAGEETPEDAPDSAPEATAEPGALREDAPRQGLDRAEVEHEAPRMERGHFIVPRVVGS